MLTMEIITFWKIVLKLIGLLLTINCFYIVPQFVSSFSFINGNINTQDLVLLVAGNLIVIFLFVIIIYIFLFNTTWLIDLLRLEKGFTQHRIDLTISTQTVLTIAVILISAVIFLQSLPVLIQELFQFVQQDKPFKDYNDSSWIVYHFIRSLVSYLALTNSKIIVIWISKSAAE